MQKNLEFFQNRDPNFFDSSARQYPDKKRYISNTIFESLLPNGEKLNRSWLMYSPKKGMVFCFMCKLFNHSSTSTLITGFNHWKKGGEKIAQHENSKEHKKSMITYMTRKNVDNSVARALYEQILSEKVYWIEVLRRIVEVIKFLAERGLPFRGDDERLGSPHNGNFLGILELMSKFDPFLKEHLEKYGSKGKGNVSYISKTIYEDLKKQMGIMVQNTIIKEVRESKYFSLIVDSTPDISKTDQLSVIIRYCLDGEIYERFLSFIPIISHSGVDLFNNVKHFFINDLKLDLTNCRGQSYDNAANMSGKFQGFQAHLKNENSLAVYIPCTAHSLNLVGVYSVNSCTKAVKYFSFLQSLYNFFSSSVRRWDLLLKGLNITNEENRMLTLKTLSDTRWSSHAEAVKAVKLSYDNILNLLDQIISETEDNKIKSEAKCLYKIMIKKEIAFLTLLWHDILNRANVTSIKLQSSNTNLGDGINLMKSLGVYIKSLRSEFENYNEATRVLSSAIENEYGKDKRNSKRKFPDGKDTVNKFTNEEKF